MKPLVLSLITAIALPAAVEVNGDWMATQRVDLSTMEETSWTASLTKESSCD